MGHAADDRTRDGDRVHAFGDDALGELDAVGLVEEIQSGRVSIPEVVEASIARVERVDRVVGAVAFAAYDRARLEAAEPRGGYFAGVPTFVKDNSHVAGMPTLEGTDAWVGRPARRDGDLTRMLRATGLLPLGKSRLSEFGFSASAEHPRLGPVRCPWSLGHTAGASSAGASALVAAGAVPMAHANDGGGSIRIPAAVNGLVGLKPTRDRFAQDRQLRQMPLRIVADGVVTRSVRDTAAYLREAERVYRTLSLAPIGDVTRPSPKRLRVALNTEGSGHPASADVREQTLRTAALLEDLGHVVEEVDAPVPDSFADDFVLYWALLAAALVRTGRGAHGPSWRRDRLDHLSLGLSRHATRHLHLLPGAVARLARCSRHTERLYERFDVLLTPVVATATPRLGHLDPTLDYDTLIGRLVDWVAFTPLANVTGEPAISLPLATSADGLPLGMMLAAPAGQESSLLGLALELEDARPFARIQDPTPARG